MAKNNKKAKKESDRSSTKSPSTAISKTNTSTAPEATAKVPKRAKQSQELTRDADGALTTESSSKSKENPTKENPLDSESEEDSISKSPPKLSKHDKGDPDLDYDSQEEITPPAAEEELRINSVKVNMEKRRELRTEARLGAQALLLACTNTLTKEPFADRPWFTSNTVTVDTEDNQGAEDIIFVEIVENSLRDNHVFREKECNKDANLSTLADILDGLVAQKDMSHFCASPEASLRATNALLEFGHLLFNSYGNGKRIRQIFNATEEPELVTQNDRSLMMRHLLPGHDGAMVRFNTPGAVAHCFQEEFWSRETIWQDKDKADRRAIEEGNTFRENLPTSPHKTRNSVPPPPSLRDHAQDGNRWGGRSRSRSRSRERSQRHDHSQKRSRWGRRSRSRSRGRERSRSHDRYHSSRDESGWNPDSRGRRDRDDHSHKYVSRDPEKSHYPYDSSKASSSYESRLHGGHLPSDQHQRGHDQGHTTRTGESNPARGTSTEPASNQGWDNTQTQGQPMNLVTALVLPSKNVSMFPKDSNWRELLTYLQKCISQKTNPRIEDWPKEVLRSINTQWRISAPEEKRQPPHFHVRSWQTMPMKELLTWMQQLTNKDTSLLYNRYDRYLELYEMTVNHPMEIDFTKTLGIQDNPIVKAHMSLHKAADAFEENGDHLDPEEQTSLSKSIVKKMDLKGLQQNALETAVAGIKGTIGMAKSPDMRNACDVILDQVTNLIIQKKSHHNTFLPASRGTFRDSSNKGKETYKESSQQEQKKTQSTSSNSQPKAKTKDKRKVTKCYGCGYNLTEDKKSKKLQCTRKVVGHTELGCRNDPRRNEEKQTHFADSTVGKRWVAAGYQSLPKDASITLTNCAAKKLAYNKGTNLHSFSANTSLQPELIPFSIPTQEPRNKRKTHDSPPDGQLLLDTGALGSNVMSTSFAKRLRKYKTSYTTSAAKHSIVTADNKKLTSNKMINLQVNVGDEREGPATMQVPVSAAIAPIGVDLIIDRDTIKNNNLVQHFPSHFAQGELLSRIQALPLATDVNSATTLNSRLPETNSAQYNIQSIISTNPVNTSLWLGADKTMERIWEKAQHDTYEKERKSFYVALTRASLMRRPNQISDPAMIEAYLAAFSATPANEKRTKNGKRPAKQKQKQKGKSSSFKDKQKSELNNIYLASLRSQDTSQSNFSDKSPYEREGKVGLDEIPQHKLESVPTEILREIEEDNEYTKVFVSGSPQLQEKIRKLIAEFKDIFRSTVQSEPSPAFQPFELTVNPDLWERSSNATPARPTGREREQELYRMMDIMLNKGLIEDCYDAFYSHAFLTPKANGSWRLVLDFKGLNKATTSKYLWPIPNIKEMLTRVGDSRPEFFAVFDLTSGYYQAPIAEESRKYTAFKTQRGIYRWKRLPMGLTDAGSYFQHQLSTNVLHGLIHNICELYLDDCMVYASNIDDYLERLRMVFQRFRECKITLNPSKCRLGLTQVEYVGHTINKDGLHFTRDKLDSVLNFPLPVTMKNIKSFLGLANYFRDHIKNHSLRVQPLQDLVEGYTKQKARVRISWTEECNLAFEDIRQAIDECPLLWFVDDISPIFLQTDASDYGIGAYLYQIVTQENGTEVEHPIGFISKSLVSGHNSWDIPMKEGFAIFYALRKWEYLLRDRRFTILTDHENLTRLRNERSANKMVTRWFMAYQDYDIISWQHVKGIDNDVPDSFSRLCSSAGSATPAEDQHATSLLFQLTGYEMDDDHWETIRTKGHGPGSDRGHGGIKRTLNILTEQGYDWPTMGKDVRKFIKMCPCCQKMNVMKPIIHSYPFTLSTYGLFHTVSVDLIEKLKTDQFGMSMIVVIIDNFSRFIDLYPISNTGAETAADALIQFTGRFTTPVRFTTDSGSNFTSDLISDLTTRLGADHQLTKAYSKEQNAIVERVNREVWAHLKALVFDRRVQNRWSKYLPIVQRYINTSVHSATGCTPAEIVFPNGAQIDRELLTHSSGVVVSAYIKDMQEAQGRIIALAEQRLRKRDQKHLASRKGAEPQYLPGEYVLVEHRHNSLRKGPKSKLLPYKAGPLLVQQKLPEGMYSLRDLITMTSKVYHVSKMSPFRYDERTLQPIQVAATDTFDQFVIEKVMAMKGDPRGPKSQIEFQVRWAGFSEANDSWISWKDSRTTNAVQLFLSEHSSKRVRSLGMKDFDPDCVDDGVFDRNSDDEED